MNKLSKAPTSDDGFRYVDRSFDSDLLSLPLPRVMMQGTYEPSAMALGAALFFRWDLIAASTRFSIFFGSWSSRCFCQLQELLVMISLPRMVLACILNGNRNGQRCIRLVMCVIAKTFRNPADNPIDNNLLQLVSIKSRLGSFERCCLNFVGSQRMQGSSNPHKLQTPARVQVAIPTSQLFRRPMMAL